jgi:hypothetical protein
VSYNSVTLLDVDIEWTLSELVAEAASSIETLPEPKNGQVRAVPDERTVRYYGTLGLLDKPLAMRGRTALYGRRHLAQVVAIKRLQSATLARMSGIDVNGKRAGRRDFWKTPPAIVVPPPAQRTPYPVPPRSLPLPHVSPVELRVELATGATLVIAVPSDAAISPADVAALRAAAAPLVTELARRGLTTENDR